MKKIVKILPHEVWDVIELQPRAWKGLIFHHSAIEGAADQGELVDNLHREGRRSGYPPFKNGMGYHLIFNPSGTIEVGERWLRQLHGAHCRTAEESWNHDYLGLCFAGNLDVQKPTEAQVKNFLETLKYLGYSFGAPHYLFKPTACPGKYFPLDEAFRTLTTKLITKWRKRCYKDLAGLSE